MRHTAQQLADYIRSHDCKAYVEADGTISATCQVVQNGIVSEETSTLQPNLKAVRDWLGY
jgi:hypothetical protein